MRVRTEIPSGLADLLSSFFHQVVMSANGWVISMADATSGVRCSLLPHIPMGLIADHEVQWLSGSFRKHMTREPSVAFIFRSFLFVSQVPSSICEGNKKVGVSRSVCFHFYEILWGKLSSQSNTTCITCCSVNHRVARRGAINVSFLCCVSE